MDKNILGLIYATLYIVLVFVTSKLISKFVKNKQKEITRKYIHIMLSNIWFISISFFDNFLIEALLPMLFVIINAISYKYNIIKIMEREDKSEGYGTIYYAISLTILSLVTFYINNPIIALPGILIMGYGDGLAAVVGKNIRSKEYTVMSGKKTIAGSTAMFIISFLVTLLTFIYMGINVILLKALIIALISTVIEAISIKGLDNITVPLLITLIVANMI